VEGVDGKPTFDWQDYAKAVRQQVRNLNQVIARNYYPLPQIEFANQESAPIGIGNQGFADLLAILDLPFDSDEAAKLTETLAACAYFNAMYESMLIAKERGYPYKAFPGSPFSRRVFQFDMWQDEDRLKGRPVRSVIEPSTWGYTEGLPETWDALKDLVEVNGVANSQLTVRQPTASCAQIAGASEAEEPYYKMLFVRKIGKGDFITLNKYLQKDLTDIGVWNGKTVSYIRHMDGSIQGLHEIFPNLDDVKCTRLLFLERKYKTAFELSQRVIIDHALFRGRYIDGAQSTSTYWVKPSDAKLMAADIYASEGGAKTIVYYTRSAPERTAVKFTLETSLEDLYERPLQVKVTEIGTVKSEDDSETSTPEEVDIDFTSVDAPMCTTHGCT
jgi:ribonucleotide reductase alpha subunit